MSKQYEHKLTGSALQILEHMRNNRDMDSFSYDQIANATGLGRSNITMYIAPLEERGLANRFKMGRKTHVSITPNGLDFDYGQMNKYRAMSKNDSNNIKEALFMYNALFENISARFLKNRNAKLDTNDFMKLLEENNVNPITIKKAINSLM